MATLSAAHAHPMLVQHAKHFHVMDTLRAIWRFASSEQFHYPPSLNTLLEDSAMAREMYRL
ncbi:hypothetical protein [[Mycobacterium] nativiensis]|uniref:Uncharacterized protein n=1 Tax=[Mycobacterium] nativiensis TaxID=2855503 RepID=A0ABU5XU51_9MYCO|nr:hypothetical protein [Mycolicibacter sp. MYC340]MEB3031502.1 hypothetical protein [Mycolicibacter sp. MYC340]